VILAIRMKDPQFSGQTKDRLANKEIREITRKNTYDLVKKFLQDHGSSAEAISQQIVANAQNRTKSEEYQKSLREGGRGSASPETPCISKDTTNNELFIVEGESAGGSAKSARDPNNQAVLPVQGKIINVEKAERVKIFENEEIKNLINALGFNVTRNRNS
jgi:DNA gyrase subunit B